MFKVSNPSINTHTHCGVMEFSSEEGVAHLPYWVLLLRRSFRASIHQTFALPLMQMMENLGISDGSIITVDSTALPKGTYVKLQPHMLKFTQIPNPRAVYVRCSHLIWNGLLTSIWAFLDLNALSVVFRA